MVEMNGIEQKRRSFLSSLGSVGVSQLLPQGIVAAQSTAQRGGVLGDGEHLIHFRDHGNVFIKSFRHRLP
jgi:hypothetical protein